MNYISRNNRENIFLKKDFILILTKQQNTQTISLLFYNNRSHGCKEYIQWFHLRNSVCPKIFKFYWVFSFFNRADVMFTFFNSSTSSPFWCICRRISQPPTNSPFIKTCGIVGQLENSLIPKKIKNNHCNTWNYLLFEMSWLKISCIVKCSMI